MSATVLVVDDDELLRAAAALFLTEGGYVVRQAGSGATALIELADSRPDLVLMDIRMPGMDGVETLRRLRKAGHDMPVLMMTHDNRPEIIRDVIALGGNGYMLKPFEADDLLVRVRKALDAARVAPR